MATQAKEIEILKKDIEVLKKLLESKAESANGSAGAALSAEALQHYMRSAGANMRGFIDEKTAAAKEARTACQENIQAHPLTYVLGALAGGTLLGLLLSKKK